MTALAGLLVEQFDGLRRIRIDGEWVSPCVGSVVLVLSIKWSYASQIQGDRERREDTKKAGRATPQSN
jgi:hypothetical protein